MRKKNIIIVVVIVISLFNSNQSFAKYISKESQENSLLKDKIKKREARDVRESKNKEKEENIKLKNRFFATKTIDELREIVADGADIDWQNDKGETLLMLSLESEELFLYLLESNININLQDVSGETVLIKAVKGYEIKAVELLLEYNVDISIEDGNGNTALTFSQKVGYEKINSLLAGD